MKVCEVNLREHVVYGRQDSIDQLLKVFEYVYLTYCVRIVDAVSFAENVLILKSQDVEYQGCRSESVKDVKKCFDDWAKSVSEFVTTPWDVKDMDGDVDVSFSECEFAGGFTVHVEGDHFSDFEFTVLPDEAKESEMGW